MPQFGKLIDYLYEDKYADVRKKDPDNNNPIESFNIFRNKPFYCWKLEDCNGQCFNHLIGLPVKDNITHALYDYEKTVYDTLQTDKLIWIKKATGLGITEFILRYMAWLAVYDYTYQLQPTQFIIVTGPNEE